MHSFAVFSIFQEPEWRGWALPVDHENRLMHCALYCQDCIHFAKFFLKLAKLDGAQDRNRSLDSLTSSPSGPVLSLEDRNRALLKTSFFSQAFGSVRAQQERAGCVYLADAERIVRNQDLRVVGALLPGTDQFFDPNTPRWQGNTTYWVAAEGPFFYTVTYGAAQTGQRNYVTPIPVLQARPLNLFTKLTRAKLVYQCLEV